LAIPLSVIFLTACDPPWQTVPDEALTQTAQPPTATPGLNINDRSHGCDAEIFQVEEVGPAPQVSIDWGDGVTTSGFLPLGHTYGQNGNYTVTIEAESGWSGETGSIITDCASQSVPQSTEGRIRYIIADVQLGNVIDYYRPSAGSDAVVAEAVRRWDAGIRAANVDQFERKIVNGNWQVVYAGSDTTIDGMDVILTGPPTVYCSNSYWPIVKGAQWQYDRHDQSSAWDEPIYTESWTVTEVSGDPQNATFTVLIEDNGRDTNGQRLDTYTCGPEGIFQVFPETNASILFLFPETSLNLGHQWSNSEVHVSVTELPTITVPAGIFQTARIKTDYLTAQGPTVDFAPGVGPVHLFDYTDLGGAWQTRELELVSYDIPSSGSSPSMGNSSTTNTYTVQSGDTLAGIAARFGVSIQNLIATNGNLNPDSIHVGQVLAIPVPAGSTSQKAGGKIAFVSNRDGNYEIYVMKSDGSQLTRLTNNPAYDWELAWSPDGSKIAFVSTRDINGGIYMMNRDGSDQIRLTDNLALAWGSVWSPDGKRIAFVSSREGNVDIYVMNSDGSQLTRLTKDSARDERVAWSPDGNKIAFDSEINGNVDICVINSDGSAQTRLTNKPGSDWGPIWSLDGRKIVFVSELNGNSEIYAMNSDGSQQTPLTNFNAGTPALSPDGEKIAFTSYADYHHEIYLMNIDGSNQTRLTNNDGNNDSPVWSPDGRMISFISTRDGNDEIYIMNADGSGQTRLTSDPGRDFSPAWQP
jgi:Tol biopolymer transport system component